MTKEEVRQYFESEPFVSIGTRKDGVEYFAATTTDRKYFSGHVFGVDWETEEIIEPNATFHDLLRQPKRVRWSIMRHRTFAELANMSGMCSSTSVILSRETSDEYARLCPEKQYSVLTHKIVEL